MTQNCLNTTANPNQGEVAKGYWETLLQAYRETCNSDTLDDVEFVIPDMPGTVSVIDYLAVFEKGVEIDQEFGLRVGRAVSLKTFPVLGMTLLSCSNLEQALRQILRYESLNHDLGNSQLSVDSTKCSYLWMPNPSYLPAFESIISFQLALSVFAGIKTFAPLLLRQDLPIRRVNFAIDRVEIASSVQQFFACPIYFGQGKNSIEVDVDLMSLDLTFADPTMFDALTKHAESLLLGSDDQNDFLRRVQALIPEALSRQNFKIEDLANELNASARTIQRKLKEQGYTYQKLVDETRLKLAKVHLRENQLSMSEIAFMVGYQEQSSFNHAFKSWTKLSPREFRLKYSH